MIPSPEQETVIIHFETTVDDVTTFPGTTMDGTTIAGTTISDTTISGTTLADTTMSDTTNPGTTISVTTIPVEFITSVQPHVTTEASGICDVHTGVTYEGLDDLIFGGLRST